MGRLPWFPLYVGNYFVATQHFSAVQERAFVRLLCAMWTSGDCTVPNDPTFLRNLTRIPARRFKVQIEPVLAMFEFEGDRITHPQLRTEHRKAAVMQAKMAAIASLGGKARAAARRGQDGRYFADKKTANCKPSSDAFPNENKERIQPTTGPITITEEEKKGEAGPGPVKAGPRLCENNLQHAASRS